MVDPGSKETSVEGKLIFFFFFFLMRQSVLTGHERQHGNTSSSAHCS